MRVLELWRHPVKSFQGEHLESSAIVGNGMECDRSWAVRDPASETILTGRREPNLLLASARLGADEQPEITLPDGTTLAGLGPKTDAALTDWIGRPVELVAAVDLPRPGRAEFFVDATDDSSLAVRWTLPPKRFVDVQPILVVTTATLRAGASLHGDGVWDVRRFRPNVLIEADGDGFLEDAWAGQSLHIGEVELAVDAPCDRCTMVTRPQPGLDRDLDIFRTLSREHGGTLGMWCKVTTPGTINVNDEVRTHD